MQDDAYQILKCSERQKAKKLKDAADKISLLTQEEADERH